MNKTAVITGITGQDGMYLAHHLLQLGYRVVGVQRRTSTPNDERLRTLRGSPNLVLVDGDITDPGSLQEIVRTFQPDEFYNLAAMSHVGMSWKYPRMTAETTGIGVLNCLEALRLEKPDCRFYQAGSSEQFGNAGTKKMEVPFSIPRLGLYADTTHDYLTETSPMQPESPYAAAKCYGHDIVQVYRRSYDMHASCGILFNHESPLRGEAFVTRKITRALSRIRHGLQDHITLGNTAACRDWGFAGDYVKAMHLMLQQDKPDDYVIATGETHSVQEFLEIACRFYGLDPVDVLRIDDQYKRPKDIAVLLGAADKAERVLGWTREKSFEDLVNVMCEHDLRCYSNDPAERGRADEFLF
jgi:GDPmannose 4,6-dehydratase